MHQCLVRFPTVVIFTETSPTDVELQGGAAIAITAVTKNRFNKEFLLVVLSGVMCMQDRS